MPFGRQKHTHTGTTIRLPYPHRGQQLFRQQMKRFNWLVAGRRWRKTTLAMAYTVEQAIKGQEIVWGAPTFDQVRVGFDEARKAALGVAVFNESRMTMKFSRLGSGIVYYRSFDDPDNARGHTADGVVIDEAADVHPTAYPEVLRPMLIDTLGWLLALGTPKGYNWLFEEFEKAKLRGDSIAVQAPTKGYRIDEGGHIHYQHHPMENPEIPWSEIEELWNATCPLLPDGTRDITGAYSFHQEIGASFNAQPGGLILPTFGPHNVTTEAEYIPDQGSVAWAVDDGYVGKIDPNTGHYAVGSHPRVVLMAQIRPTGQIAIFDESYACNKREDEHLKDVLDRSWPEPEFAVVDRSAATLKRWIHDAEIQTINGPGSVEESIKEVRSGFSPDNNGFVRIIIHPRCKHLLWEIQKYRRDDTNGKPIKEHDHGPDALRYLYWSQRLG